MTEIGLMRLCSVPDDMVGVIHEHVAYCSRCLEAQAGIDTRRCSQAGTMIERCVQFLANKRLTEDLRRMAEPSDEP